MASSVRFERAINACKKKGLLENGDITVITSGVPIGRSGTTNMLKEFSQQAMLVQIMRKKTLQKKMHFSHYIL